MDLNLFSQSILCDFYWFHFRNCFFKHHIIRNMYFQNGHFYSTEILQQNKKKSKNQITNSELEMTMNMDLVRNSYFLIATYFTCYPFRNRPSLDHAIESTCIFFYKKPNIWKFWQLFLFQPILLRSVIKIFYRFLQ